MANREREKSGHAFFGVESLLGSIRDLIYLSAEQKAAMRDVVYAAVENEVQVELRVPVLTEK